MRERFARDYGVTVSGFDISAIDIDKDSDDYQELLSVTRGITSEIAYAQAQADVKNIADTQKIMAENQRESLRMNREENQFAQHMQTDRGIFQSLFLVSQPIQHFPRKFP